jgi:MFS family permease
MRRAVLILAACQALLATGNVLIISTSALVGAALAPTSSLATLPVALQFVATMVTTLPASFFMARFGRAPGFFLGAAAGIAGAAAATVAVLLGDFLLFVVGALLVGVFNGFGGFSRFAAAEAATPDYRGKAVSYAMAGGVVAAVAGPSLARWSRTLLDTEFAASYGLLIAVYVPALLLPLLLRLPRPAEPTVEGGGRPLGSIARQPVFLVAVLGAMVGYGVMSLLMTATPLAMRGHDHGFAATASVIQWHVLAMFVPSFFTGHLISRFGVLSIMMTGALLGVGAVGAALAGLEVGHFLVSLALLGVSWNFLFIGGTTLLTESYRPEERAKTQAVNDFLVYAATAAASLSSGALQHLVGWRAVNLGVVPFLLAIMLGILWLAVRRHREAVPAR